MSKSKLNQYISTFKYEIIFIVVSIIVRIIFALREPLFLDETFTWNISNYSISNIIRASINDIHPPLYAIVLKGWNILFGDNLYVMRTMSILSWIITAILFCYIVKRVTKNSNAKLSIYIMITFLPIILSLSVYVRMYSLALPLTLGSMVALEKYISNKSKSSLIIFSILSLIACYTDNISFFALIGANVFYLIYILKTQRNNVKGYLLKNIDWLTSQIIIFILFMPWVLVILYQVNGHIHSNLAWIEEFNPITFVKIFSIIADIDVFDFSMVSFFTGLVCMPVVLIVYYKNIHKFIKNPNDNILSSMLSVT